MEGWKGYERLKGAGKGFKKVPKVIKVIRDSDENWEIAKSQVAIPKTPSDENPENEEDVLRPGRRVWLSVTLFF